MRRMLSLWMVLFIFTVAGAASARDHARTEEDEYIAGGIQGVLGLNSQFGLDVGAAIFPGGSENRVRVIIHDELGMPVAGEIAQNLDADVSPEISHTFCGETARALPIRPRVEVVVYLYAGTCTGGQPSVVTTGAVKAAFTHRR